MMSPSEETLYGIQYLRGAAAIAVVLFHAAERTGYHFAIGAAGVDVFFVISGFIMWVITFRREPTPLQFMRARIRRIVPLYWLATAVMIIGGLGGLFPNLVLTLEHVVASLLFIPARSPSNGEIWPVLVQGWTLNYEMFFYLIFGSSLYLTRRWRLPLISALLILLVLYGAVSDTENVALVTFTRPIILEFLAGMVIGEFWIKGRFPSAALGVALVAATLGGFIYLQAARMPFDTLLCGPLAAGLVVGILAIEREWRPRRIPVFAFLGDASYSIYLWHSFAIAVVAKVGASVGVHTAISFIAAASAGILFGVACHYLLERGLLSHAWKRQRSAKAPLS
ncbi:acyltransferase [Rhizobium sp. AQ_MP]|uniref:acyltransferase family protein n=1 Tax=Rhizobium sp. AQ_MP TaxID=2761536 RepID=UPI002484A91E|nr:acyltransferase [Rhizobium sp. AQ_MP]